jgi:hypothetical protein
MYVPASIYEMSVFVLGRRGSAALLTIEHWDA